MSSQETFTADPRVTYSSGRADSSSNPDLRILHYNDVYHVDPASAEPVGGLARFITMCNEYKDADKFKGQPDLLTLFSGDAFNPSLESSVTKGEHMVPVLNAIGTDVACVGNHDFDFGVLQFEHLINKCSFPWLIANVLDPALGENVPLGNAKRTHMMTTSNGIKVGIIGLGEREWLDTINSLPPNLIYKSASATAKELVPQLREQGAEIIVCLSHQREPNDIKLAEQTGGIIDIILGGHDHFYNHNYINGTHVLRSGTDFKQLSYIEARRSEKEQGKWDFEIWRRDVMSSVEEHKPTAKLVDELTAKLQKSLSQPIGWTAMPLDARFSTVRVKESNVGNFVCDIMRQHHRADCTIMASGTIRGDQIYPPGAIRIKDVTTCFPFEDPIVVLRVTGQAIWDALENGVSMYPALEGRFPQVSNIVFEFDPERPRGKRLSWLKIGGEDYRPEKKYVLATRGYMARGKDGYDCLLAKSEGGEAEEIIDEENGILISTMLRQYFMALRTVGKWQKLAEQWVETASSVHHEPMGEDDDQTGDGPKSLPPQLHAPYEDSWQDFIRARLGHSKTPHDEDSSYDVDEGIVMEDTEPISPVIGGDPDHQMDIETLLLRKFWTRWAIKAGVKSCPCDPVSKAACLVDWTRLIAPTVEGRIQMMKKKQ